MPGSQNNLNIINNANLQIFHQTFSGTTMAALDNAVNDVIGLQSIDGQSIFNRVIFTDFFIDSGVFYKTVICEKIIRSSITQ